MIAIGHGGGKRRADNAGNCYLPTKGALALAGQTKSAFLLVVRTPAGVANKIKYLNHILQSIASQKSAPGSI